jgi:glycosyltransferase involved in cell wall biosynthesis
VLPFPGVGGTEIATRRIIDAVLPFGVENSALLLRPTEEQAAYLRAAGVPIVIPRVVPEPSFRRALRFMFDSHTLARAFMDVDLIHCADVPGAYYAAVAGRLAGVPVLAHVRNRHAGIARRERFFINAATHFAFVSNSTRMNFPLRLSDARASTLYDGVEIPPDDQVASQAAVARDVRAELNLPVDTSLVVMFARVAPQKDYETLIRAAALLREVPVPVRFVVVGDHSGHPNIQQHFRHVQRLIGEAGLADRFLFTGFRSDTRRLMLAADICLLSTHFEGLPLVVLEAMALARPCVATAVDGVLEALEDGRTGLLYQHRDPAGLTGCLVRLLRDSALGERLGQAARAEARRRFGHERFAKEMLDLYTRLARPGRSLPRQVGLAAGLPATRA